MKILVKAFLAILSASIFLSPVCVAQKEGIQKPKEAKELPKKKIKYYRGHKARPDHELKKLYAFSNAKHNGRIKRLPDPTAPSFDCRDMGWVAPPQDQGNCGSCWDVSHTGVCTHAFIKAGYFKNDGSTYLSPQYVLDCGSNGGCNGDDGPTVLDMCKSKGLPTSADYGAYVASPQNCRYTNQKMYQISDWGFVGSQSGIPSVQDIKKALVAYGPLGVAVDASGWDSYSGGVFTGNGCSIDHDVSIIGWKDDAAVGADLEFIGFKQFDIFQVVQDRKKGSGGYWIVLNQWGQDWGEKGCIRMAYGANCIGTEAAWVSVTPLPPPPSPITVTGTNVSGQVNTPLTFAVTASGGAGGYVYAFDYGDGSSIDSKPSHTYATPGTYTVTVAATDTAKTTGVGKFTATVTAGPGPGPSPTNPTITLTQDMKAGTYYVVQKAMGDAKAIDLLNPQPLPPGINLTPAEVQALRQLLQKIINDNKGK